MAKAGPITDRERCPYCGEEYRGRRGVKIHMAAVHDEATSVTAPCNWCGVSVEVREWEVDEHHYCSRECGKAWNAYIRRGESHPNYVDGSGRGKEFDWVANAIRARDGDCVRCGKEDGGSDGRRLHVHHIVPEDEAENPHEPTNLLAVCGSCHPELEGLTPERQREECGIESVEELELNGRIKEWLDSLKEQHKVLAAAADPWPGMFAEAQDTLENRREDSDA
jgi:hypothetical protein